MTETVTEMALTKTDIKALRTADSVCAYLSEDRYYLIARKDKPWNTTDPWAEDKRHEIPCLGSYKSWDKDMGSMGPAVTSCFATVSRSYDACGIWEVLREGDRIRLIFYRSNNSENTKSIGWERDELHVEILRRNDPDGRKPLRFLGEVYCGPNNSARICR